MPNLQPRVTDVSGRRQFACSAAAVLGFIVDDQKRILLLSHPRRPGMWEVVNGALEAAEVAGWASNRVVSPVEQSGSRAAIGH
jgi:hypothetical protein